MHIILHNIHPHLCAGEMSQNFNPFTQLGKFFLAQWKNSFVKTLIPLHIVITFLYCIDCAQTLMVPTYTLT